MRGATINRAFQVIRMFESGPVTCRQIADRLGIHRHCAHRWIQEMSRFYPVCESGLDHTGGGRPGIVYELKDFKEALYIGNKI
jgi:predicted ArsR family transcriptional regulator